MTWFAFNGYDTMNLAGVWEKQLVAIGFHGYATQAQATAHPNKVNLLQAPTLDAMELDYKAEGGSHSSGGATPSPKALAQNAGSAAANAAKSVTNDALKPLFQGNIWIRVAEVALGLLLIAIGVAELTHAVPIATKIASVVK